MCVSFQGCVLAQNLGEKTENTLEAVEKANTYSFDNTGIGILIGYGKGNGVTAEQIGSAFVKEIKRRGEKARYFFYDADWQGVGMTFYIGHATLGPWNSDIAASKMSEIIEMMQAAKRVHSSQLN